MTPEQGQWDERPWCWRPGDRDASGKDPRGRCVSWRGPSTASVGEDAPLDRTYDALVFDWDGTAVPDRGADAAAVRARVESLCAAGIHVVVVSGTHVGNIDGQLKARPAGPGCLHLCLNRGSEVFEVTSAGAEQVWRRAATEDEDAALDRAAALTVATPAPHPRW